MKPIALALVSVLAFTAGSTLADDGGGTPRERLLHEIGKIEHADDEQSRAFHRFATAADGVSTLYEGLDAKAAAVSRAFARCADGCEGEDLANLGAAIQSMQDTQAGNQTAMIGLQSRMQNQEELVAEITKLRSDQFATTKSIVQNL
jgi:hypothetical protein